MGIARVKSVSGPVVNNGVRATGATAVAIFDAKSHVATDAHSNCTTIGPSVLTQSRADWLVTSPTATPCGSRFAETGTVSAKGLPGGSPSRDAAAQLDWEMSKAKSRKKIERDAIMAMDLPEWERCVKRSLIDNQSIRPAYYASLEHQDTDPAGCSKRPFSKAAASEGPRRTFWGTLRV